MMDRRSPDTRTLEELRAKDMAANEPRVSSYDALKAVLLQQMAIALNDWEEEVGEEPTSAHVEDLARQLSENLQGDLETIWTELYFDPTTP